MGIGAGIWSTTGSPLAVPASVAAGVLVDLDHISDFFEPREEGRLRYMLRFFHAWEYFLMALVVLLAFSQHPLFLAAVLGYLSHLALDQFTNRSHPLAYFILFRASRRFERRQLTPHIFEKSYRRSLEAPKPWWARLEPTLWRLVTRIRSSRWRNPP